MILSVSVFAVLLPAQVFEEDLHCILVGFRQLLDQVFDWVHSLLVVRTFWSRGMDRGSVHKQVQGNLVWQTVVLRCSYSLMALTKSLKDPYVKRGSGSSLKNILSAPVVTWMSSHLLSFKSSFSSDWEECISVYVTVYERGDSADTQASAAIYKPAYVSCLSEGSHTMIYSKAELLDHSQVPTHSVQPINTETCSRWLTRKNNRYHPGSYQTDNSGQKD